MRFRDIPSFTRTANYAVDISWNHLENALKGYAEDAAAMKGTFEMDPAFQRVHVWTEDKQRKFVEFVLRGGNSSRSIYWNCPGWQKPEVSGGRFVLVDGKQRLQAVRRFIRGELTAFGYRFADFTDRLPLHASFEFHVNNLATDIEVLQWYIDLNDGGVVHTNEELARVREMLGAEQRKAAGLSNFVEPSPSGTEWVTLDEACSLLRRRYKAVRSLWESGEIYRDENHGRILISRASITAYAKKHASGAK